MRMCEAVMWQGCPSLNFQGGKIVKSGGLIRYGHDEQLCVKHRCRYCVDICSAQCIWLSSYIRLQADGSEPHGQPTEAASVRPPPARASPPPAAGALLADEEDLLLELFPWAAADAPASSQVCHCLLNLGFFLTQLEEKAVARHVLLTELFPWAAAAAPASHVCVVIGSTGSIGVCNHLHATPSRSRSLMTDPLHALLIGSVSRATRGSSAACRSCPAEGCAGILKHVFS